MTKQTQLNAMITVIRMVENESLCDCTGPADESQQLLTLGLTGNLKNYALFYCAPMLQGIEIYFYLLHVR